MTKDTYSKKAMAQLTKNLPRGTKKAVAAKLNLPYTTVSNVWRGLSFKADVVRATEKEYAKMKKAFLK